MNTRRSVTWKTNILNGIDRLTAAVRAREPASRIIREITIAKTNMKQSEKYERSAPPCPHSHHRLIISRERSTTLERRELGIISRRDKIPIFRNLSSRVKGEIPICRRSAREVNSPQRLSSRPSPPIDFLATLDRLPKFDVFQERGGKRKVLI